MEGLEDGELPSSPDELQDNLDIEQTVASPHPIYTPLPRPQATASSTKTVNRTLGSLEKDQFLPSENVSKASNSQTANEPRDTVIAYSPSSSDSSESSEDSDSDHRFTNNSSGARPSKKKSRKLRNRLDAAGDGGQDFKMAAAAYQNSLRSNNGALPTSGFGGEKRKSGTMNNVWGSILREDALTSDLTSIAVGRKSLKDLNSDRGAEVGSYFDIGRNVGSPKP